MLTSKHSVTSNLHDVAARSLCQIAQCYIDLRSAHCTLQEAQEQAADLLEQQHQYQQVQQQLLGDLRWVNGLLRQAKWAAYSPISVQANTYKGLQGKLSFHQ